MNATITPRGAESEESPLRVEDLWFSDGNLVLQVGDRIFRVAGGILAVFRPSSTPLCPASSVVSRILTNLASFFERPPSPTTYPIIAGVLCLSTKYEVAYLRRRALLHLSSVSPLSLEEYDAMYSTGSTSTFPALTSRILCFVLAHSLSLTWAVPVGMYYASCLKVEHIIDGFSLRGGTAKTNIHLPPTLTTAQNHETLRLLRSVRVDGCMPDTQYQTRRRKILDAILNRDAVNPLSFFASDGSSLGSTKLCHFCVAAAQTEYKASRQASITCDAWSTLVGGNESSSGCRSSWIVFRFRSFLFPFGVYSFQSK
ncbi:hypothetical protein DFH07DRAFT_945516 [Mycena maculata]|uniref:BTB domain-containing protein n=1 Tax=Mycena maculata TaxID=230809 RepID=A0AAD7MTF0_9AGAR|nr:hypothetical protein DFH07DRAFT_945516 [Mycena maculata]